MTKFESNRVTLITGCSRGIGLASAVAFAEAGDRVYASARDLSKADALKIAATREDLDLIPVELDVTEPASVKRAVDLIVAENGRIDVLVNNAGMLRSGAFETLAESQIRNVMETNFFGVINMTRAVLPTMRANGGGRILMVSSLSGWAGLAGDSIYAASKFALEGFTEAIRHEVGRWGIRLALIEPGNVRTDLQASCLDAMSVDDHPYTEFNQTLYERLKRDTHSGDDPRRVSNVLVAVSESDKDTLRWPVGELAEQLKSKLFGVDEADRDEILKSASGMDWWLHSRSEKRSNKPG